MSAKDTSSFDRPTIERLKATALAEGVRLSPEAERLLSEDGQKPLTVHEYATTGGITVVVPGDVYVNAPFDDWYCAESSVVVDVLDGSLVMRSEAATLPITRVLPLPGYLDVIDASGHRAADTVMSHGDRLRLSPIVGCAYDCAFCDLAGERYERRDADQLIAAMQVALADEVLPVRHALISGGSPGRRHLSWFEETCSSIAEACPVPVDIMMASIPGDPGFVDRMVDAGVTGFSLNIELFSEAAAGLHIRAKHRHARPGFDEFAGRAVARLGREGAVRSLILVGLEPPEDTLAGVEHLAELGVDPVLSPFRPARNTRLAEREPPSAKMLADVLEESRRIVERHGVHLGPRCVPCQHNTLTFPWDVMDPAVAQVPA